MCELGILDGQDKFLRIFRIARGNGKRASVSRKRMKAENGASDDTKRAECARDELREIVAGDVFNDFAAARCKRAIGKRDGDADNKVAQRAKSQAECPAVVGRKDAADRSFLWPKRVECDALPVHC